MERLMALAPRIYSSEAGLAYLDKSPTLTAGKTTCLASRSAVIGLGVHMELGELSR